MRHNKLILLSISLFASIGILSSCNKTFNIDGDLFLVGIGNFNPSLNYAYNDEYKLEKDNENNCYYIKNAPFYVGDTFKVDSIESTINITYNETS
ncbi:MAG: hypothetical protein LUD22_01245, partial [Coprobacillus sp.]|nr:hypothetical protein [Coprobacillus sp.]